MTVLMFVSLRVWRWLPRQRLFCSVTLGEKDALDTCDRLVRDFEKRKEENIRGLGGIALRQKRELLQRSNQSEKEIDVYVDLVDRFEDDDGPDTRVQVVLALHNKDGALHALHRRAEALAACDDFLKRPVVCLMRL